MASLEKHPSVLLVINGTDFGGTERSLLQIADGLAKKGYGVHVLSIKAPGRIAEIMRHRGIEVGTLGMQEKVSVLNLLVGTWRIAQLLRGGSYEVVHSFLPRANIMSRIANRCSKPRAPHLSSERSTDFRRSLAVRFLNRHTARWTDLVLAVTPSVQRIMTERDGIKQDKVMLLQNGIDIDALDRHSKSRLREELGLDSENILLCSAGRLIRDKGHSYLLRAFAKISESHSDVHLVLVGDGPEESRLRDFVQEEGLRERVHFLGYRTDVIGIMKDVDVFVLPSLEEGVPVVLLEAMACGLPVIATTVGGIPDVVSDGESGLLVPPSEVWGPAKRRQSSSAELGAEERTAEEGIAALTAAIGRVLEDKELLKRLGLSGRARVKKEFSIDRVISRIEEYYRMAGMRRQRSSVVKTIQ